MLPDPELFGGRISIITGPGKGCGKTAFADAACLALEASGSMYGRVAVGVDTGLRQQVKVPAGTVFCTAGVFLGESTCVPEILQETPSGSALGALAIARASRDGVVILAGPERNDDLAWIVSAIIEHDWAQSVIVDGALNRITQAAGLPGVIVFHAAMARRSDYRGIARRLRHVRRLSMLPVRRENSGTQDSVVSIDGPATPAVLDRVDPSAKTIVVRDFTKIFLDEHEFERYAARYDFALEAAIDFGGFAVTLRDIGVAEFSAELGEAAGSVICWDAYR